MLGLMLLGHGFEDNEALTTRDVLLRAKINVYTTSLDDSKVVVSSHGLAVMSDLNLKQAINLDYDFIILPGGLKGVNNILASKEALSLIEKMNAHHKLIFAICAAPSILIKLGLLKGVPFTCFPGFENGNEETYLKDEGVVISERFITAKSMYYSIDFALAIIEKLLGKEKRTQVLKSLKGE